MNPADPRAGSGSAQGARNSFADLPATTSTDRHLPFVMRVAVVWTSTADLPQEGEGQMRYWQRAPLTGTLTHTSDGGDVSFSDLEVR
jgi:hypothetical protein